MGRGEKPKHKVPPVNGGLIYMKHSLSQLTQMGLVKDYYKFIKNPMDFGTMKAKLYEGTYTTLEQFEQCNVFQCTNHQLLQKGPCYP
ncbi:unnamed protein product [Camellia sinensis]